MNIEKIRHTMWPWIYDQLYHRFSNAQREAMRLSLRQTVMNYWSGGGLVGLGEQNPWNDPLYGRVGFGAIWLILALYPDEGGPYPSGWLGTNEYFARFGRLYHEYGQPAT